MHQHPPCLSGACLTNTRTLFFRYIFGCGEATQRLLHEHKFKLGKINNVFLTQLTWQHIGGLPGLLLTLREACKQSLTIHGPLGLSDFLAAGRCFMSIYNVDLKCAEYSSAKDGIYNDENIIVTPIPIKGNYLVLHKHNHIL